jgi:hypothetical protein
MPNMDWLAAGTIAAAIAAIAAALSTLFSYRAIRSSSENARQQRAAQALLQYVDLSIRYPDLSTSKKDEIHEWYTFATLTMAREVLAAYSNDYQWKSQVLRYLTYEKEELKHWDLKQIGEFGPDVAKLVSQVVKS